MAKPRIKNELDLKTFTFDKEHRMLVAEASDFGPGHRFPSLMYQLYDDACDIGIAIKSHLTGKTEVFAWDESQGRDNDYTGGYAVWVFKPINKLANTNEVHVLND